MAADSAAISRMRTIRFVPRLVACVLVALVITGLAAVGLNSNWYSGVQDGAADRVVFPRGDADPSIVVVGIDARSLAETGEAWPWSRATQARLIDALHRGGARVIALDIVYAPASAGDDELGATIARSGRVVVAESVQVPAPDAGADPAAAYTDHGVLIATRVTPPVPPVAEAAIGVGFAEITPDGSDGVTRRVPMVVERELHQATAFSLAVLAADTGAANSGSKNTVIVRPGGVQVGSRTIPTDEHHALRVSYTDSLSRADPSTGSAPGQATGQSTLVVSAVDVLRGAATDFHDKVVFVGATDPTLGDQHLIPLAKRGGVPGVLVHANAYNTMVTTAYLDPAPTSTTLAAIFVLVLVVGLAVQFLPLWAAGVVTVGTLAAYLAVCYDRAEAGVVMNLVYPVLAIVLVVPLSGGIRYSFVERRRRMVTALFSQYVPDGIADELMQRGLVESAIAGSRVDITSLFCDLRGFTALTAEVGAGQVRSMLEHYYVYASAIVLAHEGTVMQFVGDEVFAVFGAPVPDTDHPTHAVRCAIELQERVGELDEILIGLGYPIVRFGIGLHAGEVVAAHMGTDRRRQYTVIGDTVNIGARLCSQAGIGQVVISDDLRRRCDPVPAAEPMGNLAMKGVPDDFVAWNVTLERPPSGTAPR